jgi:hypothetical protein
MKNFIFVLFSAFLISFCIYFYQSNTSLISQNKTLQKENLPTSNIQKFKEDYYIQQLSRDTSLLLVVFPILLAITTIATFAGVREEFKRNLAEIKSESEKQISEYNKSVIHIKNLEGDLSFEVAKNLKKDLESLFGNVDENKMDDYINIVELSLTICDYYSKSLNLKSDINPKFKDAVQSLLADTLTDTSDLISTISNFELKNMGYSRFLRIKNNVEKVGTPNDLKNLASIFGKLVFVDLH